MKNNGSPKQTWIKIQTTPTLFFRHTFRAPVLFNTNRFVSDYREVIFPFFDTSTIAVDGYTCAKTGKIRASFYRHAIPSPC